MKIYKRCERYMMWQCCEIWAQRVCDMGGEDAAQLEISIANGKVDSNFCRTMNYTLNLTPAEAKELALAICPELAPSNT